jgi:hypothetical protein
MELRRTCRRRRARADAEPPQRSTRGPFLTLGKSTALSGDHEQDNFRRSDKERETADRDADESDLSPPAPSVAVDRQRTKGQTEDRRSCAPDHSERDGEQAEGPEADKD